MMLCPPPAALENVYFLVLGGTCHNRFWGIPINRLKYLAGHGAVKKKRAEDCGQHERSATCIVLWKHPRLTSLSRSRCPWT